MIILDTTTTALQVVLAAAATTQLEYNTSWRDVTTTAYTPGSSPGVTNSTTDVTMVAAPAASTQRVIDYVSIYNADAITHTVTVKQDISGTDRRHARMIVAPGETMQYTDSGGWQVVRVRSSAVVSPASAVAVPFLKVGTALEAVGVFYSWGKDTGMPGAWSPGTPGLNGRATDGTLAADNGCLRVLNAPGGSINLLTGVDGTANITGDLKIVDVMWVNTGLVTTTTTAQAIAAPVALPARDTAGTTNGAGVFAGILVTTATTNAGAITNTTISYTNSDGVAGRTGTIASFPSTAVIGTVLWFQLAAGDMGVRSVQSVTLGTSYGAGAISLILGTWLMGRGDTIASVGGQRQAPNHDHGVRLYDGVCMLPMGLRSATTATTIQGNLYVATRAA